jgi:hypothetical protein
LLAGSVVKEFGLFGEVQLINTVDCRVLLEVVVITANESSILSEFETSAIVFGANVMVFAAAKHEVQNLAFDKAAVEIPYNRGNFFEAFPVDGSLEPHVLFPEYLPNLLGFFDALDGLG